jgi:hypothetical protein
MMADSIVIAFNDTDTINALRLLQVQADAAAREIVVSGGDIIARYAKDEFRGDRTALPEPPQPTIRSNNLRTSIRRRATTRVGPGRWMSETYPSTVYARRVELGGTSMTRPWGHLPKVLITTRPFPYMAPGLEKATPKLELLWTATWATAMEV